MSDEHLTSGHAVVGLAYEHGWRKEAHRPWRHNKHGTLVGQGQRGRAPWVHRNHDGRERGRYDTLQEAIREIGG